MKMVKSLLLGSAAGLVAVAGAQAADLPVKAKAVEYVKICSLYGAGFYYIPGTDICMKVGGYVRFQQNWANGGSSISNGPSDGTGGRNTRTDSSDFLTRTRAVATFDTRQQTQYGVLRTYLLTGFQQDSSLAPSTAPNVYITRGFIQIAGFTFGKATSYYDFFPRAAVAYHAGSIFMADTGDAGQMLAAYTAQFGGGVSMSIAAEQSQRSATVLATAAAVTGTSQGAGPYSLGVAPTSNNLGASGLTSGITGMPDIVANIRFDGTWGAFQLAGVLHDASGGYYSGTTGVNSGHPTNKWGWGISPGLRINAPMIGPGDYFVVAYSYTQGAIKFASSGNNTGKLIWNGQSLGYGNLEDGVYSAATTNVAGSITTDVQLTTAWSVAAAYEHFWTPALQTSIYGSYLRVQHNDTAKFLICGSSVVGPLPMSAGCDPDWSQWNIGSRTQWNVVRGLYVGLDVLYTKLLTARPNTGSTLTTTGLVTNSLAVGTSGAQGGRPVGTYNVADQSAWAFAFRIHRDVVP